MKEEKAKKWAILRWTAIVCLIIFGILITINACTVPKEGKITIEKVEKIEIQKVEVQGIDNISILPESALTLAKWMPTLMIVGLIPILMLIMGRTFFRFR